jgi:succinate-semialdehyde dehydrogenase/glutarate-semialdehyde dehydrogenase
MGMQTIEIRNPATGGLVGSVPVAGEAEIQACIGLARTAQKRWAALPFSERAARIRRFHDLVLRRSDEIMDVIQSETGKARRDAFGEIITVAGAARYYLKHGRRHLSVRQREAAVPAVTDAEIVYKPVGVVGLITPWNYPFILAAGDTIPALLAGNAVVLKPSELTPLSAILARRILMDAGLDPDLLGIVHGTGQAGGELIRHVDYVGFTGGTVTGRKVAVAAAERLIPFSLELGGKNPMIVLEGAPLEDAASGLIAGAFSNSGQTCIAVERIYVQESVFDEFARRVIEKASSIKVGWSKQWDIEMGSLISNAHADKVTRHIEEAKSAGAKVLAGGRRRVDLGKAFVEPTVMSLVPESVAMSREETFGPVVSLYPVRDREEAIARANDSEYGLNASIWTGDGASSLEIARRLETGSAAINSTLLIYNSFDVPMGGVKQSGVGRRHGEQGILRYTQAQSIVSSLSTSGGYDALTKYLDRPSRAAAIIKALRLWRRI